MIHQAFEDRFGAAPDVVVRSPGRVNLIGEHTDYSLLPVMPMAIDRAVDVAVGTATDRRLRAASTAFPGSDLDVDLDQPLTGTSGWHRYVVAAVRTAAWDRPGLRVLVGGDLPVTGGLSSSSALTVGLLRACDRLRGVDDRPGLIERAVRAERSLGVEGGTMDQTVIVTARPGSAMRIDFLPPGTRPVPLPPDLAVVAAYSGNPAPKGDVARDAYNLRVVASRAAAVLTGHIHGVDAGTPPALGRVADVIEPPDLPEAVTAAELAAVTGVDLAVMVGLTGGRFGVDVPLPVRTVASFVVEEARRVDAMEAALGSRRAVEAGRILDASHAGLREFGASTPALDVLSDAMRRAGAHGARVTGAGFGGYAIAVCPPGRVGEVVAAAIRATGGPAFPVTAAAGVCVL